MWSTKKVNIQLYLYTLFLICAEGLTALLRQAESTWTLKGLSTSRGGPQISHLFSHSTLSSYHGWMLISPIHSWHIWACIREKNESYMRRLLCFFSTSTNHQDISTTISYEALTSIRYEIQYDMKYSDTTFLEKLGDDIVGIHPLINIYL